MKVIGVTGLPGSGKSLFFDMAKEKGVVVVSMGDIIREKAAERGENIGTIARKLREEHGQYIVAKLTIEKIKEFLEKDTDAKVILVEGIRSPYEIEMFEVNFDNFTSVSLYASPKTRFERVTLRNRKDDSSVYEDFKERDQRELDFGIGSVIATADYLIKNEDSFEEYKEQVVEFFEKEMD
ncbi:Dephospho-CoA kinase [Methanobrevibacter olleyae]|uniref:UPF0200 protein SAMN02910297_01570 n=1 Tax=Methanobrevibacter olleyae TaxID=294671 RepID=A0A1I4JWY4_METOL|nr:nucleoside monophosphate kinase [Methanobrevibacter olleyae]SFL71078.1 Dephospho-CoA kinase [Methanobrevibacter olleyae]